MLRCYYSLSLKNFNHFLKKNLFLLPQRDPFKKMPFLFLLFFLSVCTISSCSIGTIKLYPGPEISNNKLSFINNPHNGLQIRSLDSNEVKIGTWWEPGGGAKETAAILPGKHTFKVKYNMYNGSRFVGTFDIDLEANLEAGHEYSFNAEAFLIPKVNETDCHNLPNGSYLKILTNSKDSSNIDGYYCNVFVPYIFDRTIRQITSTTLKKETQTIVIDKSTLKMSK